MEYSRYENKNFAIDRLRNENVDRLAYNMLKYQKIPGLLEISFRYVDDCIMAEYDITGLQPLRRIFERRKLRQPDIAYIMRIVAELSHELEEYMLGIDSIVLSPDLIFAEADFEGVSGRLRFCCSIGTVTADNPFRELLCFFMDGVDYSDTASVGLAYSLVRAAEENEPIDAIMKLISTEKIQTTPVDDEPCEAEQDFEPLIIPPKKKKLGFFGRRRKEKRLLIEQLQQEISTPAYSEHKEFFVTQPLDKQLVAKKYFLKSLLDAENVRFEIDHFPFLIGKLRDQSDYILESPMVSRVHAQFTLGQEGITLEDMNSSNGTYINGASIFGQGRVCLKDGDTITFADQKYRFEIYG